MIPLPAIAFAGLAGACLGSFVVTAALRATRAEQAVRGRSRCDSCGVQLGFAETVPVVSYLALRGACRRCGGAIEPWHLVGEVSGALALAGAFAVATPARAAAMAMLGLALLASASMDAATRRLPDALTLVIAALALLLSATAPAGRFLEGLVSCAVAFALMEGVRQGYLRLRRRPGLGFGDVKLTAALALWLGAATPWAMVLAAVLALAAMAWLRPADGKLAFGPALAGAAWLVGLLRESPSWPILG